MPIEFTAAELREIKTGLDLNALDAVFDVEALIIGMGQVVDVDKIEQGLLVGPASPEKLAAARISAVRQSRKISTHLVKSQLKSIGEKVRDNIAAGNAYDNLWNKLDEIRGLDSGRAATLANYKDKMTAQLLVGGELTPEEFDKKIKKMHDKLLRDRKKVIAQTEQRMATADGGRAQALANGNKWKRWITAGDDLVSDMDETNEGQGWIAIDEAFSSGDMVNPSHPRCRCTVTYRTLPPDKFDKASAKQAAADTKAAKKQAETDDKAAKEAAKKDKQNA